MIIVHCIFSLKIGGAENMLIDIVNEQCKSMNVKLIIVNSDIDTSLIEKIDKSIEVVLLHRQKSSRNLRDIIKLNYHLFISQPRVIHCHNHNIINLLLPSLRRISVLTVHDVGIFTGNFKRFSKLFAISKSVQIDIFRRTGIQSTLIYNGINISSVVAKTSVSNKLFQIVQVSRLDHVKKGQDLTLRAIRILKDEGVDDIVLSFIGSGDSEEYLKKFAKQLEIEDQIIFLSSREREFIYDNLKLYDLLVQPSRFEGFGLTVVEAIAAKLPVLVSNIDGPMEIIDRGKYGYYFDDGDVRDFAAMIKFIKSEDNKQEVIKKTLMGYEYILKNFDIKSTAANYVLNY